MNRSAFSTRSSLAILIVLMASSAHAVERIPAVEPSAQEDSRALQGGLNTYLRAGEDTLEFGSEGGDGFAVEGEKWTWDHGGPDPLEGWEAVDATAQTGTWFRQIDDAAWSGGGNLVPLPVLTGLGSAWVGAFENEADEACWVGGLGYGNDWNQRLESPPLEYLGSGDVSLAFEYFCDNEENFEYTRLLLRLGSGTEVSLNGDGFSGPIGMDGSNPPPGAVFSTTLAASEFAGETSFSLVFEFTSDGGWSDEDGEYTTVYGPFGVDDIEVSGALVGGTHAYGFETDLEGWTPRAADPIGSFMGAGSLSTYTLLDTCDCGLSDNVLEFHDDAGHHPYGQHLFARSNPVHVLNDVLPLLPGPGALAIAGVWDQYSEMPRANGVFYRPGWDYYPYVCPVTGATQWSGRVGQDDFFYVGNDPVCVDNWNSATSNGIPSDVEQIRFVYELHSSCDAFGIPPQLCTEETNFTPLIDNVWIQFSREPIAPRISFGSGTRYRDSFSADGTLSPTSTCRSDVVVNTNFGDTPPFIMGDSLYVSGPTASSSTRWEARLWFRIIRKGAAQDVILGYPVWRDRVSDGRDIENGEFTFAWMDSFELGTQTARNKFVSYLRESDDDYDSGSGEFSEHNEILPDDVFVPGTQIQYFVSSNYTATPTQCFLLPDTSGGFFNELKFVPGYQEVDGVWKFPSILYIDAENASSQYRIEPALNVVLHGAAPTDPIPERPLWDRFDYLDPACCWSAPFARGSDPRSTSGATLIHMLGYRAVLFSSGSNSYPWWPEDANLLSDWLSAVQCDGDERQGMIVSAHRVGSALDDHAPVLGTELGVSGVGDWQTGYRQLTGDDNYCVQIVDAPGATYPSALDYDISGNGCPDENIYSVLQPVGTGDPSRSYKNVSTGEITGYQQITNESIANNFRSVVLAGNYANLATRESVDECTPTFERVVLAASAEIEAALNWMFDGNIPGYRENPNCIPVSTEFPGGGAAVETRLFPPQPNPVRARTTIRFQLAAAGDIKLAIFDVGGRRVRELVRGGRTAGVHEAVWDGTDDRGAALPAGIYWSQLEAAGYRSGKKLVILP